MKKTILLSLVIFFLFLTSCHEVFAVSVSVTSFPSTIPSTDPFQVNVSVTGATNATNYLRIDLYKEGTTNYFGETYNGNDWYSSSDGKNYYPIQIQNASSSATITTQIGNPSTTEYPGPGIYKLKIRRYTSSGSQSTNDNQTPVDVQITYTFPTHIPDPTPTPVPTPTPISILPTTTPTKLPLASPKPTATAGTPNPTPQSTNSPEPEVLGESTTDSPIPIQTPIVESININKPPVIGFILIGIGILFIGFSGYIAFKKTKIPTPENEI